MDLAKGGLMATAKGSKAKADQVKTGGERPVEDWRRCPSCFGGWGGVGHIVGQHVHKSTKYLKCQTCGHTWSAVLKVVAISINQNLSGNDSERILT